MKSSQTSSIKSSSTKTTGAIRSATRNISGNARDGKVSFMSLSKNANNSTNQKDENGNPVNKSTQSNNSDQGDYTKDNRQGAFAARLTQSNDKLAFSRIARFTQQGIGPGSFASGSSGGGLGAVALSGGSWAGTGAVASGLGNDSLPQGNRWERGDGGYIGGTAQLDPSDLKLLEGGKGDGNFSVINSTVSSKVSWMTNQGNYLTQHIKDEVTKIQRGTDGNRSGKKSLGQVFNEVHGKNVGGNSQTLNINGNKLDNSFGTKDNPVTHAVFLADLKHGQHGGMFEADYMNFRRIAIEAGANPDTNIKVVDNWDDYKKEIAAMVADADKIRANDPDAKLNLLTGTAAHGYCINGQGVHDPEGGESGFSVRGQDVREKQIEDLVGMADAHFDNTLMINCPCHSGGFDGKTNLVKEGRLSGSYC
jgi:hypothetical protein